MIDISGADKRNYSAFYVTPIAEIVFNPRKTAYPVEIPIHIYNKTPVFAKKSFLIPFSTRPKVSLFFVSHVYTSVSRVSRYENVQSAWEMLGYLIKGNVTVMTVGSMISRILIAPNVVTPVKHAMMLKIASLAPTQIGCSLLVLAKKDFMIYLEKHHAIPVLLTAKPVTPPILVSPVRVPTEIPLIYAFVRTIISKIEIREYVSTVTNNV